jgi:hypothetical protein
LIDDTDYILGILALAVILLLAQSGLAWPADNQIYVDQINNSSSNTVTVTQDGTGHTATVSIGAVAASDSNNVAITQQGTGAKTATVQIAAGVSNGVVVSQDGAGAHKATVQALTGSANNISITQSGDGAHEFNIINSAGTTNTANTVNATQSGGAGSEKWFNVWFGGSTGAIVNVNQGGIGPSQASMNIQCAAGTCGTYSYNRQ